MNKSIAALFAIALASIIYYRYTRKSAAPLPPGPRGLPLLGNVVDLPQHQPWTAFAKWGEIYGGIVHVSAFGKSIIILNDIQYAIDMLDKKGLLYSDRPTLVMAGQLVGWDAGPGLASFSRTWTEYRRLLSKFMGTRAKVEAYERVLQEETNNILAGILMNPTTWVDHSRRFAGAIVLMLAYGYKTTGSDDAMVKLVNEAMDQFSEITANNAFLVDVFPILRYVPAWFPGAAWKRKVPKYRQTLQDMIDIPFSWVNQQITAGTAQPSFLSTIMDDKNNQESIIKWTAASIYSGGADTTWAGIESFFLAMTLQPSAQQKAQEELDSVIGTDRLPTLADRDRLPYFEAMLSEVLRMYVSVPLGLPHVLREDDVHNGYFIPKGSIVVANSWQFGKDPKIYANPSAFYPERFMASEEHPKEMDPRKFLFGFGRRICPGIHLADPSMWLACISIVAAFNISPPTIDGKPVYPPGNYLDGTISHPEPFECVIEPRSQATEALVRAACPN